MKKFFKGIKDSYLEWKEYYIVRGEKKVGERGRAFVPRGKAKSQPVIKITARKYTAENDSWEDVEITNVHLEKV